MAFTYQKRGSGAWHKRQQQRGGGFLSPIKGEFPTYAEPAGSNHIRILPPTWTNPEHYGIDLFVHYGIGPDRGTVICLDKWNESQGIDQGDKCPICQTREAAALEGNKAISDQLKNTKRVAVWIIDRKNPNDGPKVFLMPWTLDRDISKVAEDPTTHEVLELDNPKEGYDIFYDKVKGKSDFDVKRPGVQPGRKPTSVPDKDIDFIVAHPLPDTFNPLSRQELDDLMQGTALGDQATEGAEASASADASTNQTSQPTMPSVPDAPGAASQQDTPNTSAETASAPSNGAVLNRRPLSRPTPQNATAGEVAAPTHPSATANASPAPSTVDQAKGAMSALEKLRLQRQQKSPQ